MIEQSTSKGTRSESVYSDMEGDTMDTQQTEATEMSLQTGLTTLSVGSSRTDVSVND